MVKVALVAASVAVYSVIFTVEFALALVAVLIFHEYGHVRAMKKFGIPTTTFFLYAAVTSSVCCCCTIVPLLFIRLAHLFILGSVGQS